MKKRFLILLLVSIMTFNKVFSENNLHIKNDTGYDIKIIFEKEKIIKKDLENINWDAEIKKENTFHASRIRDIQHMFVVAYVKDPQYYMALKTSFDIYTQINFEKNGEWIFADKHEKEKNKIEGKSGRNTYIRIAIVNDKFDIKASEPVV